MADIIKPSQYPDMPLLVKGRSFQDVSLPFAITRMTDANADGYTSITIEYATMCPWNADNSRFLALLSGGSVGLFDAKGNIIKVLPEIVHSSEPRWGADPDILYYIKGNSLVQMHVPSLASKTLRTFEPFKNIYGAGESDMSEDRAHLVLSGGMTDNHGENQTIFLYNILTDDTTTFITWPIPFNNLQVTPDNNILVSDNQGVWKVKYNSGGGWSVTKIAVTQAHQDVTRVAGREILVRSNSADPTPVCPNGIEIIDFITNIHVCVLQLGWSPRGGAESLACHISCSDNGRVLVSTYAPSNPSLDQWEPYTNELILIDLNITPPQVVRLAHHRSIPFDSYQYMPKANISRDGTKILFNSNWGKQPHDADYSDIYSIDAPPSVVTTPVTVPGWRKIAYKPGSQYLMVVNPTGSIDIYEKG